MFWQSKREEEGAERAPGDSLSGGPAGWLPSEGVTELGICDPCAIWLITLQQNACTEKQTNLSYNQTSKHKRTISSEDKCSDIRV